MFEPDIVVTDRGDYAERFIVVEVKMSAASLDSVDDELRGYMVRNNYLLGVLVAPGEIRLYRNRYSSYEADSVERIGVYAIAEFDQFSSTLVTNRADEMARLETAVQDWIERLPLETTLKELDEPLRSVLAEEFAPYVRSGEVRAAHHRHQPGRAAEARRPR